ncbi:SIS domain-containing protein [Actinomyces vulturis]|uniref:SIS domain-containing protein n=1 Tax=Actinomyces vulturis TaxID=1857645 RepID=UPI00082E5034|nr:SIS domain-containing protein [Actinomyces vulturis]
MTDYTQAVTYQEVCGQIDKWRDLATILTDGRDEHETFLKPLFAKDNLRIILTGAGTSAFVGEIAAPAIARATGRRVEAVPTTDIVSNPYESFAQDVPTLLVSFARSGNSPESLAATELADQVLSEVYHLVLTCAPEGQLAVGRSGKEGSLVVLMPDGSNDKGFAMTSSFTCMLLSSLVLLGAGSVDLIEPLAAAGDYVVAERQDDIRALATKLPKRVVYLGSGPLRGLAHEAGLKFLELTAGDLVSFYESSMGFRHGPKAVIDETTQAFVFISSDPYTRQYDVDILNELRGNLGTEAVLAIAGKDLEVDNAWVWPGLAEVPDAFVAVVHILVAQFMGVFTSAALDKNVDNPFPAGDVNRVVQGVIIHPLAD